MSFEVIALKTHDVSDQQFPVLRNHLDEAGAQTIGVGGVRDGIQPQHFDGGFEHNVVWEDQGERQDLLGIIAHVYRYANASAAHIHGFLYELTL